MFATLFLFLETSAELTINPSYELQTVGHQQQPMVKDSHLTRKGHKSRKGHGSKDHVSVMNGDRDGNFIDDEEEYERDYVGKYTENYNSPPIHPQSQVVGKNTSSYYFLDVKSPTNNEIQSPVSKIPRLTRIFGGFLKNTKTKIEGRVYTSFNNNFCQFKEDLCEFIILAFKSIISIIGIFRISQLANDSY
jgi:hypothetical protein